MELIKKQYEISKASDVNNFVGWMIDAIRTGYGRPVRSGKVNKFNNFEQREYDYDELEKELLQKTREKMTSYS